MGGGASLAFLPDGLQLFVGQVLDADKGVLRRAHSDEFVQLDLDCGAIAVLGILYEEDHQKRNDRCPGVDDQLPRIRKAEDWSCNRHIMITSTASMKVVARPAAKRDPV